MVELAKHFVKPYKVEHFPSFEPVTSPLVQAEFAIGAQTVPQHAAFDKTVWEGRSSFHNEHHIMATYFGIEAMFKCMHNPETNTQIPDYLNPYFQLERYNEEAMNANLHLRDPRSVTIRPEELEELFKITFLMHDTGNIQRRGCIGFVPLEGYKGIGAEERSYENAEYYFSQLKEITPEDKQRYLKFIHYLLQQTKFVYDGTALHKEDKPFGVLSRYIDVVAQGIINFDRLMVQVSGLIDEQSTEEDVGEKESYKFTPANTYGFLWKYTKEIIKEENYQEILKALLGRELPAMPSFKSGLDQEMLRRKWADKIRQTQDRKLSKKTRAKKLKDLVVQM